MESLAQVGVQLLLFTLGLEFSLAKLRAVRSVALIGGVMQILLTMVLAGGLASAIGASIHEGVFIGALVRLLVTRGMVPPCLHAPCALACCTSMLVPAAARDQTFLLRTSFICAGAAVRRLMHDEHGVGLAASPFPRHKAPAGGGPAGAWGWVRRGPNLLSREPSDLHSFPD